MAAARRFVQSQIGDPSQAATAALLVSELATNVVRHARSELTVEIIDGATLRVEVHDRGGPLPDPMPMQADANGGRGLHIVAAFARTWGSATTASGKVVWFEL